MLDSCPIDRSAVLAEFGEFSLRSGDLDEVLHEACRLVGLGLGTDLAKVMECRREDGAMLVRAGVGWRDGVVGRVVVPDGENSSEHEALRTGVPLVIDDVAGERRLDVAPFIRDHGVASLVNVPILGPGGTAPYGLLQVDSRSPRRFDRGDIDFLRAYANLLSSSVERLRLLPALREAVAAKDRLLRELQHRVKNNLQVIGSLVQIQVTQAGSADARRELDVVGRRIETMRLMHSRLYADGDLDDLDLAPHLREVGESLIDLHDAGSRAVGLTTELEGIRAPVDVAIPLGLIVNEFLTNSLKHAFGERRGIVGLKLAAVGEGRARLVLWDDGKGLPEQGADTGAGTGLRIIEGLAGQIGATHFWESEGGARLTIEFTCRPR